MPHIVDQYAVFYNDQKIGSYYVFSDDTANYYTSRGCPWDLENELATLGLDKNIINSKPIELFTGIIEYKNRVSGRRRITYQDGPLRLERKPLETTQRFSVYRRRAEEGEPDYSPLPHDAPHWEGPKTPEGMREWASWYAFNKKDDGTFEAELDEAWWWGGGHNDGGTIRTEVPEEWFELPYDDFLERVVTLSAAAHYGFTPEILKGREGLKEFFGY